MSKKVRLVSLLYVIMLGISMILPVSTYAYRDDYIASASIDSKILNNAVQKAIAAINCQFCEDYSGSKATQLIYEKYGKELLIGEIQGYYTKFVLYEDFREVRKKDKIKILSLLMYYVKENTQLSKLDLDELLDGKEAIEEAKEITKKQYLIDDEVGEFFRHLQNSDKEIAMLMLPGALDDVHADLFGGYSVIDKLPILKILSVLMGVVCVILIIALVGSTVIDLVYMGVPTLRESIVRSASQENVTLANENNSASLNLAFNLFDSSKAVWVSHEAKVTILEAEKSFDEYRNVYFIYFRRRALTYIILATCIMYLICGGISGIIAYILNLVSGAVA